MAARDVQLIVRAKDEASRAISAAESALKDLLETGKAAGRASGVTELLGHLVALEKAAPGIESAAAKGDAAFRRLTSNLGESRAKLAAVEQQILDTKRAIDAFPEHLVSVKLAGGDLDGAVAAFEDTRAALGRLIREQAQLKTSVAAQQAAIGQSRSSLQELGSTATAVEAALASLGDEAQRSAIKAKAAIEAETAAWREQGSAIKTVVDSQRAIDTLTGVRKPSGRLRETTSHPAQESAAVFDEQIKAIEGFAAFSRTVGKSIESDQIKAAQAVGGFARNAAKAESEMAAEANVLRARLDPVAAIQAKLNGELERARSLYRAGAIDARELGLAEQVLAAEAQNAINALERTGRGEKGKLGLFGLKPYELTNLSFQINDVVTGLASGQSAAQILAQQGGQILQIFPRVGSSIIKALADPRILAAAVTVGVLVASIKRALDESERLRQFQGVLDATADGSKTTGAALNDASHDLDRFGMSAEQAVASVRALLRDGVNPARIQEFGRAAQNLADIYGIDLKDAVDQVGHGFTSNFDAIAKLDDSFNFLTTAEREHIRAMFESGQAAEGRAEAFRKFEDRMDSGAAKARSTWARAIRGLDAIWAGFLKTISDLPPIHDAIVSLQLLGELLGRIGDRAASASGQSAPGQVGADSAREAAALDRQIQFLQGRINTLKQTLANVRLTGEARKDVQELLEQLNRGLAELQKRRAALHADPAAGSAKLTKEGADAEAESQAAIKAQTSEDQLAAARRRGDQARAAAVAGEIAYQKALRETNNVQVAAARRRTAEAEENSRLNQQRITSGQGLITTARRFDGFNENRKTDRNSLMDFFRSAGIDLDPQKLAWCAAFVNAVLAANGLPQQMNAQGKPTVAAADFKNFGTGVDVSNAEPGDIVVLKGHVGIFAGFDGPNRIKLIGGNQGGGKQVQTSSFARSSVVAVRRAPLGDAAAQSQAQFDQQRDQQQTDFTNTIERETKARELQVAQAERLIGLSGDALLAEQRRQAIETAIADKQQEADRTHVEFTKEARDLLADTIGKQFDLQHLQERATKPVEDLGGTRSALIERFGSALTAGDTKALDTLQGQIDTVDKALGEAIDRAESWWAQFDTPEAASAIANLENLREEIKRTGVDLGQQKLDLLSGDRQGLLQQLEQARSIGDTTQVKALEQQIHAADSEILKLIDHQISLWEIIGGPAAERAKAAYQRLRNEITLTARDTERAGLQQNFDQRRSLQGELQQGLTSAQQRGDTEAAKAFEQELAQVDTALVQATDDLIAFWQKSSDPNAAAAIAQLQNFKEQVLETREVFAITAGDIQQAFAGDLVNAVDGFAQAIGEGRNAIGSLLDAARSFASSFLRNLAELVIKALALKLALKIGFGGTAKGLNSLLNAAPLLAAGATLTTAGAAISASGVTIGVGAAALGVSAAALTAAATLLLAANSASVLHTGGIVGSGGSARSVSSLMFAGAMRYHSGGIAGLRPNEMPAILERGEEVLTKSDPRHRFNRSGDGQGGPVAAPQDIQIVNAIDAGDFVSKGLATRPGQRSVMNFIRSNSREISQLLGNR
jgi:uncharacterized protein (TIGR02594 family)